MQPLKFLCSVLLTLQSTILHLQIHLAMPTRHLVLIILNHCQSSRQIWPLMVALLNIFQILSRQSRINWNYQTSAIYKILSSYFSLLSQVTILVQSATRRALILYAVFKLLYVYPALVPSPVMSILEVLSRRPVQDSMVDGGCYLCCSPSKL